MRVAIDAAFWGQPRTGSGQYIRHLWSALPDLLAPSPDRPLLDVTALLPSTSGEELPDTSHPGLHLRCWRPPAPVAGRSGNLDKLLWEQWGVASEAKRARARLLHTPYLAAPLRPPCSLVVTAHDMIPWVVPGYRGSPLVRLYLALAAAAVKRARIIMADSEASRRDVIKVLRVSPKRVRTVYLGIEPPSSFTGEELEEVRARFRLPPAYAFYIGGFDSRKNVPLLLRAWRLALGQLEGQWCEEEKPVLAIGGSVPAPGGVFPDVRGEAERLGLLSGGTVRFLGRIGEEEKPLLMAAATLFAYPSAYEGFGLDPLEAMSVGCPVVSSVGGSLVEVVGEGGLTVPPNDERALCEAMVRAWTDAALRTDLRQRGRARAARFTWERTARETVQVYLDALKGRRVGG